MRLPATTRHGAVRTSHASNERTPAAASFRRPGQASSRRPASCLTLAVRKVAGIDSRPVADPSARMLPSAPIAPDAAHVAAQTQAPSSQTGLDRDVIEAFLRAFYAAARQDTLLGPSFAGVENWEKHIATITGFWCSVALMTGEYHGRPMQAHARLALTPAHFTRWLALFETVARARLTQPGAEHMLERARRIARSLEIGLIPLDLPPRGPRPGDPASSQSEPPHPIGS